MPDKLYVENEIQKTLFTEELQGQISDGYWENSRPHDHYKPWCRCEVVVRPASVGRDFYADRDRYNFTAKDLLDCVGDRMLEEVQKIAPDATMKDIRRELNALKKIIKIRLWPDEIA